MSNYFKGTKGNWTLVSNDYGYYTSVRNLDDTIKICVSRVNNEIESNANMLLISKAPEMLEMLKIVYDSINMQSEIEYCSETYYKIEQLIKQATEI